MNLIDITKYLKNKGRTKVLLVAIFMLTLSCSKNINNEQDYLQYISNPKHNLVKTKYINGFKVSVKYIPPEIQAYNELKNELYTQRAIDSLLIIYENSRTFILTIAPDERKNENNDIMFYNVMNTLEFKERVQAMNFNISEYISLKTENNLFYPVLHLFENTYELAKHRNLNVVFSAEESNTDLLISETLDFVFNDYIFQTGISHFQFRKKDLDDIPRINFWETKQN